MYLDKNVLIKEGPLYDYCNSVTTADNSSRNAALFRMRQVMTATQKEETSWFDNEREIMNEIERTLPFMGDKYHMPTKEKWFLSYPFLNKLMRITENPDFFNNDLPKQSAQEILKSVVKEKKGYCVSCKDYKKYPEKYTGKPKLPNYKDSGSKYTVVITNQDCVIYEKDETEINADLKGSANIGRKALGNLFSNVNFGRPTIVKHPYRNNQKEKPIGSSKLNRLNQHLAVGL